MIIGKTIPCLLALALLATAGSAHAAVDGSTATDATLAADGRSFSVTAPGVSGFRSGFAANIRVGGNKQVLSSTGGVAAGPPQQLTEDTPYGKAQVQATTLRFAEAQVDLLFLP